jgi:hypothetical protein
MRLALALDDKDFDEYYKWFENTPYIKGMLEIDKLVKERRDGRPKG